MPKMRVRDRGDQAVARAAASTQAVRLPVRHEDERAMSNRRAHIRWVFFDVGDTLLDERAMLLDEAEQICAFLRVRGVERTAQQFMAARERAYAIVSPIVLKTIGKLLDLPADVWRQACDAVKLKPELETPWPGTTEALTRLAARFKLGVIANQPLGTHDRLCGHGWEQWISLCISSAEEKVRKPEPAIFDIALRRAECRADEAAMVGDRVDNDIRPAKAVGFTTVRILQGAARLQEPRGPEETADFTARNIAEVVDWLLS
jgi:HAD superfamily hydrolase (TIGR01549 family)